MDAALRACRTPRPAAGYAPCRKGSIIGGLNGSQTVVEDVYAGVSGCKGVVHWNAGAGGFGTTRIDREVNGSGKRDGDVAAVIERLDGDVPARAGHNGGRGRHNDLELRGPQRDGK